MKTFIQNRKGQKICLVVKEQPNSKGLAFVMHGLGGYKEQPQIQVFAQAFLDCGYSVVLFDTTNTFGESDGDYADATTTGYYQDLEDVIEWSKSLKSYHEPFYLIGHSLGSLCMSLYAENHPNKVAALVPMSTVISAKLSCLTPKYNPEVIKNWRETGWLIKPAVSRLGTPKKIKWSEMEDRLKYDLLDKAGSLTMPVLMIVGERDTGTPPEHQKILFDALPGKKEMHIIKGAPHTFKEPSHLTEIKEILIKWIRSLPNT